MAKDKKGLCLNCKVYPKINDSDFCNAICATLYKIENNINAMKCEYSDNNDDCTITVCPYINDSNIFCNQIGGEKIN